MLGMRVVRMVSKIERIVRCATKKNDEIGRCGLIGMHRSSGS